MLLSVKLVASDGYTAIPACYHAFSNQKLGLMSQWSLSWGHDADLLSCSILGDAVWGLQGWPFCAPGKTQIVPSAGKASVVSASKSLGTGKNSREFQWK